MRERGWRVEVRRRRGEAEAGAVKEESGAQKIEAIKGRRRDDCIFFTVKKKKEIP